MIVDSFRFLPRSFRAAYELEPTGEPDVWSEFEPTWGDPSYRVIPRDPGSLAMAHLHVNDTDVRADRNVALPLDVLAEFVLQGVVGSSSPQHVSVMGYQGDLAGWRTQTAPSIVELLVGQRTNGVVLAPV